MNLFELKRHLHYLCDNWEKDGNDMIGREGGDGDEAAGQALLFCAQQLRAAATNA